MVVIVNETGKSLWGYIALKKIGKELNSHSLTPQWNDYSPNLVNGNSTRNAHNMFFQEPNVRMMSIPKE